MTNVATLTAILTLVAAGAMTGVFFAFSVSVVPGLNAIDPYQAVAAMQSANEKILHPVFLVTFVGTPLAGGATGALLLAAGHAGAAWAFLAAAGAYLLGSLAPTFLVNVPLNDALAAVGTPADAAAAHRAWHAFSPRWTTWNHTRTAASTAALLLAILGLHLLARDTA